MPPTVRGVMIGMIPVAKLQTVKARFTPVVAVMAIQGVDGYTKQEPAVMEIGVAIAWTLPDVQVAPNGPSQTIGKASLSVTSSTQGM